MTSPSSKVGAFFDDKWQLYQQAVRGDLLCHAEMFTLFNRFLRQEFDNRSFCLADLGCGDGSAILETLGGNSIDAYYGIDAGRELIDKAARTLSQVKGEKAFICGDMAAAIRTLPSPVDVILCSYSVHHILPEQKKSFVEDCYRQLNQPGYLIMIDGIRSEGETRDEWLDRLDRRIAEKVPAFTREDRESIMKHPRESDFPETIQTFREIAAQTGWSRFDVLLLRDDFLAFLLFRK